MSHPTFYILFHTTLIYTIHISYFTTSYTPITYEHARTLPSMIIRFNADKEYTVQLRNNNRALVNVKWDVCTYAAKIVDEQSYGVYNMCSGRGRIYAMDKTIVIDKEVEVRKETNDIEANDIRLNAIGKNDIKTNAIKNHDIKTNDIKNNDIKNNDIKNNDIENNNIENNDIENNDIKLKINDIRSNDIRSNDIRSNDIIRNQNSENNDTKYMKVFMINDSERVKLYGTEINQNTLEIYEVARRIIEREDWGEYNVKLVLNGILNIMEGGVEDVKEMESDDVKTIESDSLESSDTNRKYKDSKRNELKEDNTKSDINIVEDESIKGLDKERKKIKDNDENKTDNVHYQNDKARNKKDKHKRHKKSGKHKNKKKIKTDIDTMNVKKQKLADEMLRNQQIWDSKPESQTVRRPCIRLQYKEETLFDSKDVNLLDAETEQKLRDLSKDASNIYNYKLNEYVELGFSKVNHRNNGSKSSETASSDGLKRFADIFEKIRDNQSDEDSPLSTSNLVILFKNKEGTSNIEGMTFIGGACSKNDPFSIIKLKHTDSTFYHGKVTAHEILHSLDARHDKECGEGFLMEQKGCTTCMEDDRRISKCTIKQVVAFIDKQDQDCFRLNELCGNGIIDEGEECDSGLPFGSDCCTATCKLRKNCECDDRNGSCCVDCKLIAKNTECGTSKLVNSGTCLVESVCDGLSPVCQKVFKQDGEPCLNGFCKNGVCQSRDLFCERVGRKYDKSCSSANECEMVCVDKQLRCSVMGAIENDKESPIFLPDGMPCKLDNNRGKCAKGRCEVVYEPKRYVLPLVFVGIIFVSATIILLFFM